MEHIGGKCVRGNNAQGAGGGGRAVVVVLFKSCIINFNIIKVQPNGGERKKSWLF